MDKMASAVKAVASEGESLIRIFVLLGMISAFLQATSVAFAPGTIGRELSLAIGGVSVLGFSVLFIVDQTRRRHTLRALESYRLSIEKFLKARANPGENNYE